jgi:hypothetical protein
VQQSCQPKLLISGEEQRRRLRETGLRTNSGEEFFDLDNHVASWMGAKRLWAKRRNDPETLYVPG